MTDDKKTPAKKPRKKKTTAPSRAKAIRSAVQPKESPKPSMMPAPSRPSPKRSLMPVFLGAFVIIVLLVFMQYGSKFQLPALPEMPEFPSISSLFPTAPEEDAEVAEEKEDALPLFNDTSGSEDTEAQALKQKLVDAEDKIQQLQSIVQEKDQAIQREIALRGQSLLAQYARLMEHALEQGLPFPWELEQFQRIAESSDMQEASALVKTLTPYAQGAASEIKLREDFNILSTEIYVRWRKESSGGGVKSALSRMFGQIITIRPVGLVQGDTPDAVLARTQYYLEHQKLQEAAEELSAIADDYAEWVKPWMEQAALRLEAEKHIQALHDFAQKIAPINAVAKTPTVAPAAAPEADDLAQPSEVQEP